MSVCQLCTLRTIFPSSTLTSNLPFSTSWTSILNSFVLSVWSLSTVINFASCNSERHLSKSLNLLYQASSKAPHTHIGSKVVLFPYQKTYFLMTAIVCSIKIYEVVYIRIDISAS